MDYQVLKKNFERHGFATSYFETKEAATAYLEQEIQGELVAFGGSITAQEMKLDQVLSAHNEVVWHWLEPGSQTLKKAREATVYICSANGASQTGELVNIDGTGNRVAMTLYGPAKTYFLVGSNKISPDLCQAIKRAKDVAALKNAVRLHRKTPCAVPGATGCSDCNSPDRICKATVILERPCGDMEVEVVFINEELGY